MGLENSGTGQRPFVWYQDPSYPPIDPHTCAVPYDDRAGCAINIEPKFTTANMFIEMTFVTAMTQDLPHDITVDQAETLVLTVSEAIRRARSGMREVPVEQ